MPVRKKAIGEGVFNLEENRMMAVKAAYWDSTPADHPDRDQLAEVLRVAGAAGGIVGAGLSWGLSDTEVRERLYEFLEGNRESVSQTTEQCLNPRML